jgi:hypothetical protein
MYDAMAHRRNIACIQSFQSLRERSRVIPDFLRFSFVH